MTVRTFETMLWDDHATTAPFLSRVLAIVHDAGYVVAIESEIRTHGTGGTYMCDALDMDPRSGVRNYSFRVFEDPARPVIERIADALREPGSDVSHAKPQRTVPQNARRKRRRAERRS